LRRIEAGEIGGFGSQCGGFRHLAEVGRGERNGNRASREMVIVTRFLRLFPISPLSTGLFPNFLLPRLGSDVHGHLVIGTAVPASPRASNGRRVRQVTKGPISAGRQC
jgi:hypothetical protein